MREASSIDANSATSCTHAPRALSRVRLGLVILFSFAVLIAGLWMPHAMLGDEVRHYFMLTHQADVLPSLTFEVFIPTGWGETEFHYYAHANLWHYAGAWLYRLFPYFASVQIYQALFFAQLLFAGSLLLRSCSKTPARSTIVYLLTLASLPMSLLFSVVFYLDVPMTAQLLTAFYLLERRRWVWATLFLVLALCMKETAALFIPAFFVMLTLRRWSATRDKPRRARVRCTLIPLLVSLVLVSFSMQIADRVLSPHGGYYPLRQVRAIAEKFGAKTSPPSRSSEKPRAARPVKAQSISVYENQVSAYHPGDLREPKNWLLYGGGALWVVLIAGAAGSVFRRTRLVELSEAAAVCWPFWVGLSFLIPAAFLLRASPDARFFYPAVPFLLIPVAESAARLVRPRIWIPALLLLCLAQAGGVLAKTVQLRSVSDELKEGIAFLGEHLPEPRRIFMYPEGNYRLFPAPHDWYLGGHLREFWLGDNDTRIGILARRRVGAIVIKKDRVAHVDAEVSNLGVYPDYFAAQLDADARFRRVFDNDALAIYEWDSPELLLQDPE